MKSRCCLPNSCKGYEGYYVASHNRKVVYKTNRGQTRTLCCYQRPEQKVYSIFEKETISLSTELSQDEKVALK
jgi:hypothetical protein